jgi:putative (di)nucleoside polyphosphate hydrolase
MSTWASKKQYRLLSALLRASGKTPADTAKTMKKSDSTGVGVIVVDDKGRILLGVSPDHDSAWAMPGGGVDEGESALQAALRELEEETGLKATTAQELDSDNYGDVFLVKDWTGNLEDTRELQKLRFFEAHEIPWSYMRACCVPGLTRFFSRQLKKSRKLKDMLYAEKLEKNIARSQVADTVYQLTHGDALKLVGNGTYRLVRAGVKGMGDDEVKEIKMGSYILVVRKHANDIYSGQIRDGHKTIHHFVNRSLPTMTAELMSVFEWYLPEDIPELDVDDDIPDDVIDHGIGRMVGNYRNYNLADVYDEMESIREEVRHGAAVDIQQVEERIGKLIDALDSKLTDMADKHNDLARALGSDIDELEAKLKALKSNSSELKPESLTRVTAVSSHTPDVGKVIADYYEYLSRPSVTIEPNGKIHISFSSDWSGMDQSNFLKDLKAKALKKN